MKLAVFAAAAALLALSAIPAAAQSFNPGTGTFPGVGTYAGGWSQSGVSGLTLATGGNSSAAAANAGGNVHVQSYGDPWTKIDHNHYGSSSASGQDAGADFYANGFGFGFAGWLNQ